MNSKKVWCVGLGLLTLVALVLYNMGIKMAEAKDLSTPTGIGFKQVDSAANTQIHKWSTLVAQGKGGKSFTWLSLMVPNAEARHYQKAHRLSVLTKSGKWEQMNVEWVPSLSQRNPSAACDGSLAQADQECDAQSPITTVQLKTDYDFKSGYPLQEAPLVIA